MSDIVKAGRLIDVRLRVRLPVDATWDQITDWIEMEIGGDGSVDMANPLSQHSPEAWDSVEVEDTGHIATEEVIAEWEEEGVKYQRTQRRVERAPR